jgi:5-methylcytosine-specific restriction endonuclease McrA
MKECRVCGDVKPVTEYYKKKTSKDGLMSECKECNSKKTKEYYKDNKEKIKQATKLWKEKNYKRHRELQKRWENKNKEKTKLRIAAWQKKNRHKVSAKTQRRNAAKIKATPLWITEEHLWMIEEIYELRDLRSEATGIAHQVDHIIPLRGKGVCGLHVPWNLQVITAYENKVKGNRF